MEIKGPGKRRFIEMYVIKRELDEAEAKAWGALARYKFQMFGYWSGIWVHLNHISGLRRANPWKALVQLAKERRQD